MNVEPHGDCMKQALRHAYSEVRPSQFEHLRLSACTCILTLNHMNRGSGASNHTTRLPYASEPSEERDQVDKPTT